MTAVLGSVVIIIAEGAAFPRVTAVEIDVTVLGGRVELQLPAAWKVGPGRFVERALHLKGELSWNEPVLSGDHVPGEFEGQEVAVLNEFHAAMPTGLAVRPGPSSEQVSRLFLLMSTAR